MHGFDRFDQITFGGILQQVAFGAHLQGSQNVSFVGVHAEDHDRRMGQGRRDTLRRFDPAQIGHGDIHDRDIRLRRFGLLHRLPAIRRLGDHAEFRLAFQQQPQAPAHYGVIVS